MRGHKILSEAARSAAKAPSEQGRRTRRRAWSWTSTRTRR